MKAKNLKNLRNLTDSILTIRNDGRDGLLHCVRNDEWKSLLYRRLRDEANDMGVRRVSVSNVRLMKTRPEKMYAVVVADCCMYAINGCNENEMARQLRARIYADRQAAPKGVIYFKQ
jgi:hypothetical protein